ncbi:MAG: putative polysaccharide biosynthesis protein [Eubacteriales bacterium]
MTKNTYIKGAGILAMGGLMSRFIGLFYKSIITKILGSYAIGLYYNTFYIFSFLLSFLISAVPLSISKMTAEKTALGYEQDINKMMRTLFLFLSILGFVFTVILFRYSQFIISLAKWDPQTYYPLIGISFSPMIIVCICIIRGYFQGINNMKPTAVSQIIESIVRLIVGVPLCYYLTIKYSQSIGAGGATLGTTISEGFSLVVLFYFYLRYKDKRNIKVKIYDYKESSQLSILKRFIQISLPVSISSVIISVYGMINSFTYPSSMGKAGLSLAKATEIFGDYCNANTLANIPLTFSMALSMAVIPTIAQSYILKDKKAISYKVRMAIRLVLISGLPSIIGLALLAKQLFPLIFNQSLYGSELLKWNSISIGFIMLSMTFQSMLQGLDNFHSPIKNLLVGLVVKWALNIILIPIPSLHIYGMVISNTASYALLAGLNLRDLHQCIPFKMKARDVILPLINSILMGGFVWMLKNILIRQFHDAITIVIVTFSGAIVYLILLVVTGTLKEKDFNSLPYGNKIKNFYKGLK